MVYDLLKCLERWAMDKVKEKKAISVSHIPSSEPCRVEKCWFILEKAT
jgi:hypothetical protein